MINELAAIDQQAFLWVNSTMANSLFDHVLPWMRNEFTWIPLYVLILTWAVYKFKARGGFWVLWCILTVVLSDVTSSHLIKKTVCRPRPCHIQEELVDMVLRVSCGTGYSFTSSHAANHMAMAAFILMTGTLVFGRWKWLFLPWALLIGFAQIYVGVHYPLDVTAGFLLGALIAWCSVFFYRKMPLNLSKAPAKHPKP